MYKTLCDVKITKSNNSYIKMKVMLIYKYEIDANKDINSHLIHSFFKSIDIDNKI